MKSETYISRRQFLELSALSILTPLLAPITPASNPMPETAPSTDPQQDIPQELSDWVRHYCWNPEEQSLTLHPVPAELQPPLYAHFDYDPLLPVTHDDAFHIHPNLPNHPSNSDQAASSVTTTTRPSVLKLEQQLVIEGPPVNWIQSMTNTQVHDNQIGLKYYQSFTAAHSIHPDSKTQLLSASVYGVPIEYRGEFANLRKAEDPNEFEYDQAGMRWYPQRFELMQHAATAEILTPQQIIDLDTDTTFFDIVGFPVGNHHQQTVFSSYRITERLENSDKIETRLELPPGGHIDMTPLGFFGLSGGAGFIQNTEQSIGTIYKVYLRCPGNLNPSICEVDYDRLRGYGVQLVQLKKPITELPSTAGIQAVQTPNYHDLSFTNKLFLADIQG